jgi:hypothetical protein
VVPVEPQSTDQLGGPGIDAHGFEHDSPIVRLADLDKTPVSRQENAVLGMGLLDEFAIVPAAFGDHGVVPGDTQPATEADQHLVA